MFHRYTVVSVNGILQSMLPDWAVLNFIVRVNIGLGEWTQFGQVWSQFGGFKTYQLYRLIG